MTKPYISHGINTTDITNYKPDFEFDEVEASAYTFKVWSEQTGFDSDMASAFMKGARYQHSIDKEKHEAVVDEMQKEIDELSGIIKRTHDLKYPDSTDYTIRLEKEKIKLWKEIAKLKEKLEYYNTNVHSCSEVCTRLACVQRREIDALKEKLGKAVKTIIELKDSGDFRYDEVEKSENVLKELGEL